MRGLRRGAAEAEAGARWRRRPRAAPAVLERRRGHVSRGFGRAEVLVDEAEDEGAGGGGGGGGECVAVVLLRAACGRRQGRGVGRRGGEATGLGGERRGEVARVHLADAAARAGARRGRERVRRRLAGGRTRPGRAYRPAAARWRPRPRPLIVIGSQTTKTKAENRERTCNL